MRLLFDLQFLHEYVAADPMAALKRWENAEALRDLPAVLAALDALPPRRRQEQLVFGLLAGNMFDWGAHAVVAKLETGALTFEAAGAAVLRSPHLDDSELFFARLDRAPAHRRAIIFVDNAGFDIGLGVLPFVRYLLQRGTEVVLAANSLPALNDITYRELLGLIDAIAQNDVVIQQAVLSGYAKKKRKKRRGRREAEEEKGKKRRGRREGEEEKGKKRGGGGRAIEKA